jgi:hypothetical protein
MKQRIRSYLQDEAEQAIVFSGFGELAADLSIDWPIRFVEYSQHMAEASKVEFPRLENVICANVLDHLISDSSPIVLILCRVSAYWQDADCFERLLEGLAEFPRQLVLIDFFDSAKLVSKSRFEILASGRGNIIWDFFDHRMVKHSDPTITLSKLNGRFDDGTSVVDFDAKLAFFNSDEVYQSLEANFSDYEISIEAPLVVEDPSFLMVLRAK